MSTKRTDIHRPSELIPADYDEVFPYNTATSAPNGWPIPSTNVDAILALRKAGKMADIHRGVGQCDHCGGSHIYGSVFQHLPTGKHIIMGWICAAKAGFAMDESAQAVLKKDRKAATRRAVEKARRIADLRKFVQEAPAELLKALKSEHYIIRDIRSRIPKYGISNKQIALVMKLAAQEEAAPPSAPVIEGKIEITGTVLSMKSQEGYYGSYVMKMLVLDDRGFKVWGTCPQKLMDHSDELGPLRGQKVKFTATVEASRDDETFGFFKRPTKASRLV